MCNAWRSSLNVRVWLQYFLANTFPSCKKLQSGVLFFNLFASHIVIPNVINFWTLPWYTLFLFIYLFFTYFIKLFIKTQFQLFIYSIWKTSLPFTIELHYIQQLGLSKATFMSHIELDAQSCESWTVCVVRLSDLTLPDLTEHIREPNEINTVGYGKVVRISNHVRSRCMYIVC